jgi:EmrB/QacA subfamily drug resistance transporter
VARAEREVDVQAADRSTTATTAPATARASGAGVEAGARSGSATDTETNPWLVLLVLCTAVFMLLLDTTIINVAQRKIQVGLGTDLAQIQWVLDSYILTYAVLLLSFGRMGDVFGRKKLFVLGLAIFTAASALCAASVWLAGVFGISAASALVGARVLQGVGGALMMPQSLSLLTVVFPHERRGAALGIWGGIVALGAIAGPVIGGLIVTDYAWEWIFLINIPVGIAAIIATIAIVPESTDPRASRRIDWGGVLLSGLGIFALVYALIEGNALGWTDPLILGLGAASVVLLTLFVWWETRQEDPMMKLELFRIRNFWVGSVIALTVSFGMLGIFFPMTLFLQGALGYTPIRAGLTMLPMSLMLLVVAPIAGRLTDKIGARWILIAGLGLMTAGIVFIVSRISVATDWQSLLPALVVTGAGMGMTFSPMTAAAMKEVPPAISGSASGIINTMRNVGQVLGIAVLGSVLQSQLSVTMADQLTGVPLAAEVKDQVVELAADSRVDEIPALLQAGQPDLIPPVMAALQHAFADAIQTTFLAGAAGVAVALLAALFTHNPLPAGERPPAMREREAASATQAMAAE